MDFEVVVDEEKCVGCGTCTYFCPKSGYVWEIGKKQFGVQMVLKI